ncbi:MAG: AmmeMemoRadiSam system radical SAM enzyme [bacterium]|nr:AmmeMemoRadiSam system radical SAM enzyme [bacterium]
MKEALFYEVVEDKVKCQLCPHGCLIKENKRGICRGRINKNNKLYSMIYQECSSVSLDPIEKKPLYHFYPGSMILSLGTVGCSFKCQFCQNWHISQTEVTTNKVSSAQVINIAKRENSIGVSYTYSEPLIWYEYVLETAQLAKQEGLANILVTNGYINEEPLLKLLPYIDGLNIDIKSFKDSFYKKYCGASLEPVLKTVKIAKKHALIELTNLVIPGLNDNLEEIEALVEWIYTQVGGDTPLHFSRYYPQYKMNIPPTPIETLKKAYKLALKKLNYVYIGNVVDDESNATYCPNCKKAIIKRSGYHILSIEIKNGICNYCGVKVNVVV